MATNGSINLPPIGDVDGPQSSVDTDIALFDGPTGKFIKDSGVPIGSVITQTSNILEKRYVDFLSGNDTTGNGSIFAPWKTIQKAYDSITDASINRPYTVYLSGGNNDSDAAPITGKPNIGFYSEYPIQISQPITITGSTTNDGVSFTNIIFIGALTWIRNDFSQMSVGFRNAEFFSGPVLKNTGGGAVSVTAYDSLTVNMDLLTGPTGSFFFNHTFLGTTTFGDADFNAYYELMGGYTSSAMSFAGGITAYMSGLQSDVPFGYTLTAVTTANGTPTFQTDSSSIPPTISGSPAPTLALISQAKYVQGAVRYNYNTFATTGNGAGVETDYASHTITRPQLGSDGEALSIIAAGTFAGGSTANRIKLKLGSTTIYDSGSFLATAGNWILNSEIIRAGNTSEKIATTLLSDAITSAATQYSYSTASENLSTSLILKMTINGTSANDVIAQFYKEVLQPAS